MPRIAWALSSLLLPATFLVACSSQTEPRPAQGSRAELEAITQPVVSAPRPTVFELSRVTASRTDKDDVQFTSPSGWPGRGFDPILRIGDRAFSDYSYPSAGVLRFAVEGTSFDRESVVLSFGPDSRDFGAWADVQTRAKIQTGEQQ